MGTMGLLGQFGSMASGVTSNEPLQQHRDQTIQTPRVTGTECQSGIDDDDNKMEDEDGTDDDEDEGGTDDDEDEGGTDDDDIEMEQEGIEDESAPDDEDYVEGQDDTSNASSEVKERQKVSIATNMLYICFP